MFGNSVYRNGGRLLHFVNRPLAKVSSSSNNLKAITPNPCVTLCYPVTLLYLKMKVLNNTRRRM